MDTKIQLVFKCETALSNPNELSLKSYLEKNIKGLVVASVKKEGKQFAISSNLLSVVFASEGQKTELIELKTANKKLQAHVNILKGELAATHKLKDQLAKNFSAIKAKDPEVEVLVGRLKEIITECEKTNKNSVVAIEENKVLAKAMSQMESDRKNLFESTQKLAEELAKSEETLSLLLDQSKTLPLHNSLQAHAEHVRELGQFVAAATSRSVAETAARPVVRRRRQSLVEEAGKSAEGRKEGGETVSAVKRELSEKCEEYAELEEAYNTLEGEYQLAENQIEALQASLEEKEKLVASLRGSSGGAQIISGADELAAAKKKITELQVELKRRESTALMKGAPKADGQEDKGQSHEEAKHQLEDSDTTCTVLKDAKPALEEQLFELKEQREMLVKEQAELKAALFDREQKLMLAGKGCATELKYKVFEEVKNLLYEILSTYATTQTIVREMKIIYTEKVNKTTEYGNILNEYLKENNKKERIRRCEAMQESMPFLNAIPKKTMHIGMLDKIVIDALKAKVGKGGDYKALEARYEKLMDLVSQKIAEYELKLSRY